MIADVLTGYVTASTRDPLMFARSRLVLASLFLALTLGPACAGGSIALPEVMQQLKGEESLIAEIEAELEAQDVEADDVTCSARFGNHWKELGGARAIPFECVIGKRELQIEGVLKLYDGDDRPVDIDAADAPDRAVRFTQTGLQWKWSDAASRIEWRNTEHPSRSRPSQIRL